MWKATGPIFILSKYRISRIERYRRTMSITGKTQKMVVRDITQLFAKHTFEHSSLVMSRYDIVISLIFARKIEPWEIYRKCFK